MKIKDRVKPKVPTVDPGVYVGICIGIIDLGEQYSEKYKNYSNKIQIVFELPTETIEVDGKQEAKQLSKTFNVAAKVGSKFRDFISAWNGKVYSDDDFCDLELFEQLGKPCMLNVVNSESGEYSNIETVMPLIKGMLVPVSHTEYIRWDMDAWNDELFQKLPEWVQDNIKKSTQYQKEHAPNTAVEVNTIPQSPAATAPFTQGSHGAAEGACPI